MIKRKILFSVIALIALAAAAAAAEVVPLERAHAHNDYEHQRPLLDALDRGFCSVEADINLIDGKLLVAHSRRETKPDRTLEALYLDPLKERIEQNGGCVYKNADAQFWLLIDIKGSGQAAWPVLNDVLKRYKSILTSYKGKKVKPGPVSVVVDNADRAIAATRVRYAAIDGRLRHLDEDMPVEQMPWVSSSWGDVFSWKGEGEMPAAEHEKLRELVKKTHDQGKKLRFWALPRPWVVWPLLYEEGVDFLNADSLDRLRDFLLDQK